MSVIAHPEVGSLLERSAELDALTAALASVKATRRGRLVLVAGEAGIGKTALLQGFCAGLGRVRVLSGACEALRTPRPLGPFLDVAEETGGALADVIEAGASPGEVLRELLDELRWRAPTLLVLEDVHWADEATLDLIRLLARRIATVPTLVVVTYRDELDRRHPLRVALGELATGSAIRVTLAPLSLSAVAALALPSGADPQELHERTAGNCFYVTEALAAGAAAVPASVRDAVLARAARLNAGARSLLDAVAVTPPRAELWLLEALAAESLVHLEECLASGMLRTQGGAVAFRHEIARVAIEQALPPDLALALHRCALTALTTAAERRVDGARVAHHAEAAGDGAAVLRYARAAAERASRLGAHREAAAQIARALRFAGALSSAERGDLHDWHSYECYLTSAIDEAIESRRLALVEHHARGDRLREGDARRWLSRLLWYAGDGPAAEEAGRAAVEILEPLPDGPELAMAYSNLAQLRMLTGDFVATRAWGELAIELARRLGETKILVHALNNVGTAELKRGSRRGLPYLKRSLELARAAGLEDDVGRAHTNFGAGGVHLRDFALADRHLDEGIAYASERDLDSCRLYMLGWKAQSQLDQGQWREAAATALSVLDHPNLPAPSRVTPLVVLGRLRARRGEPDAWDPLDVARTLAQETGELQRLAPVAVARAEARWLAGEVELLPAETDQALALAIERADPWATGELLAWRRRAGINDETPPVCAEPFRLELTGSPEAASRLWQELGCPYEAALAILESSDEQTLRASLEALQRLGARRTAARVARALRERGLSDLPRGPIRPTRTNPAGLTARQLEVLELLAEGLRNADIAERLVVSAKTIDHHVGAILRKLKTATRTEAAAEALRLGLIHL